MPRRETWGFWYDPETKKVYPDAKSKTPVSSWTFDDLQYINPNGEVKEEEEEILGQPSRPLNFFYAPTKETAAVIFAWAKRVAGWHSTLRLQEEPVARDRNFSEWSIYGLKTKADAEDPETSAFSVGLLAASLLRNGVLDNGWAARSFQAELKQQGAWID